MAVRTEQADIVQLIVLAVSVHMVKLERHALAQPLCKATIAANGRKQTLGNEPKP